MSDRDESLDDTDGPLSQTPWLDCDRPETRNLRIPHPFVPGDTQVCDGAREMVERRGDWIPRHEYQEQWGDAAEASARGIWQRERTSQPHQTVPGATRFHQAGEDFVQLEGEVMEQDAFNAKIPQAHYTTNLLSRLASPVLDVFGGMFD